MEGIEPTTFWLEGCGSMTLIRLAAAAVAHSVKRLRSLKKAATELT